MFEDNNTFKFIAVLSIYYQENGGTKLKIKLFSLTLDLKASQYVLQKTKHHQLNKIVLLCKPFVA